MCDLLVMGASQIEVAMAAGFILGLLLELFPVLSDWKFIQKALLTAGISIVVALGAFGLGATQGCWLFTQDAAMPFVIAGLAAAVAALTGEGVAVGGKGVRTYYKNR